MIIAPNVACVLGVFTLGFGVAASVFTNNVAALAALANGLLPMRKVALLEAERRHQLELELKRAGCANVDPTGIHEAGTAAEAVDAAAEIDEADDGGRSALAA